MKESPGPRQGLLPKVKEELKFIPAQLKVLEIRQEKAVFERDGEQVILAAKRQCIHWQMRCHPVTAGLHHHLEVC